MRPETYFLDQRLPAPSRNPSLDRGILSMVTVIKRLPPFLIQLENAQTDEPDGRDVLFMVRLMSQ